MDEKLKINKEVKQLAKLMDSFRHIMDRLDGCSRWGEFPMRDFKQTSFQHSFFIAILTAYLAKREEKIGRNNFDSAKLIVHALTHDFSEGITGDVTFRFKNDPRLKLLHSMVEHEQTVHQIRQLSPLDKFLEDAFNLEPESLEARFFHAIEYLDYFLYALSEYVLHDTRVFSAVIFRHHKDLAEFAKAFPSIREIYTPEIHEWVKKCVEHEEELISTRRFVLPEAKHLDDMIKALTHLMEQLEQSQNGSLKKQQMVQMVIKSFENYE